MSPSFSMTNILSGANKNNQVSLAEKQYITTYLNKELNEGRKMHQYIVGFFAKNTTVTNEKTSPLANTVYSTIFR